METTFSSGAPECEPRYVGNRTATHARTQKTGPTQLPQYITTLLFTPSAERPDLLARVFNTRFRITRIRIVAPSATCAARVSMTACTHARRGASVEIQGAVARSRPPTRRRDAGAWACCARGLHTLVPRPLALRPLLAVARRARRMRPLCRRPKRPLRLRSPFIQMPTPAVRRVATLALPLSARWCARTRSDWSSRWMCCCVSVSVRSCSACDSRISAYFRLRASFCR